ncbi:hypothetical protein, partial [Shigella flexneri]
VGSITARVSANRENCCKGMFCTVPLRLISYSSSCFSAGLINSFFYKKRLGKKKISLLNILPIK